MPKENRNKTSMENSTHFHFENIEKAIHSQAPAVHRVNSRARNLMDSNCLYPGLSIISIILRKLKVVQAILKLKNQNESDSKHLVSIYTIQLSCL